MNRYDELCEFKLADIRDVETIMEFIKIYWSPTHILATDKDFFLSEFLNGNKINFFLSINKCTMDIEAIMGFYPYSQSIEGSKIDFSGGILSVNPNSKIPMLGMEMPRRLYEIIGQRAYIGNGANPITALPLEKKLLRHHTGRLRHFYILSNENKFEIAKIKTEKRLEINEPNQLPLIQYFSKEDMYQKFDDKSFRNRIPYKDSDFVGKRYFNHPIYKYKLFGAADKTVIVSREVVVNEHKILRIVDILGECDKIRCLGIAFQKLLSSNGYEYIDIYQKGICEEDMRKAGFVERELDDENIIPNYFEPFIQKNIEIYFHTDSEEAFIFKADGDQDRPNQR